MDYLEDHNRHMGERFRQRKELEKMLLENAAKADGQRLDARLTHRILGATMAAKAGEMYSRAMQLKNGVAEKTVSIPEKELERLRAIEATHDRRETELRKAERGQRQAERRLEEYMAEDRVAVARALDLERMVDILQAEVLGLRKPFWLTRALGFFR